VAGGERGHRNRERSLTLRRGAGEQSRTHPLHPFGRDERGRKQRSQTADRGSQHGKLPLALRAGGEVRGQEGVLLRGKGIERLRLQQGAELIVP
jgi:hypothetical protein